MRFINFKMPDVNALILTPKVLLESDVMYDAGDTLLFARVAPFIEALGQKEEGKAIMTLQTFLIAIPLVLATLISALLEILLWKRRGHEPRVKVVVLIG